jgi:hypothetical protein
MVVRGKKGKSEVKEEQNTHFLKAPKSTVPERPKMHNHTITLMIHSKIQSLSQKNA